LAKREKRYLKSVRPIVSIEDDDAGEKLSLSRRAVLEIERRIASREFEPGDRLPAQRDLASSMGISRAVLREAISVLEAKGLLQSLMGSGTYVRTPETDTVRDAPAEAGIDVPIKLSAAYSKLDFCRFRIAIEVSCIRLAAMKITDRDIDALTTNLQLFKENVRLSQFDQGAVIDAQFHCLIVEIAGVQLFTDLYRAFQEMMVQTIAMLPPVQSRGWEAIVEHGRILEALKRRDPDEAVYYMRSHITRSAERLGYVLSSEIL
jgi:GntR family transcriptional regulator, transcriptional repressor for pyruvate dehydrogenase complex